MEFTQWPCAKITPNANDNADDTPPAYPISQKGPAE